MWREMVSLCPEVAVPSTQLEVQRVAVRDERETVQLPARPRLRPLWHRARAKGCAMSEPKKAAPPVTP